MPNWCYNELRITGDEEKLIELQNLVQGKNGCLDFDKVIPYPDEYRKQDEYCAKLPPEERYKVKDGYNSGGYDWCIATWGTKWNACEPSYNTDGETIMYSFDTAWSPPEPIVEKLSEMFPTLHFELRFEEGGMGFSGYSIYEKGIQIEYATGSYNAFPLTEHECFDEDEEETPETG